LFPSAGSLGYEALDIEQFAEWNVDGIGLDNCALPFSGPAPSTDHSVVEYRRFQEAWRKANHSGMALQIWSGGFGKPGSWAPGLGHFWRSGPDLVCENASF
jgi:alpha-galactosidase